MSRPRPVAEILAEHVPLELEGIDRLYRNVSVPQLQTAGGVAQVFRAPRGQPFASSALMEPISRAFVAAIERFVREHDVPLLTCTSGQRKADRATGYLARFTGEEGLLFVGQAQEKSPVFRTQQRRNPVTGRPYPWLIRSTAMVTPSCCYGVAADFGPFFLKFGASCPSTAKLCLNGHASLKRQLTRQGIGVRALDNGLLSCDDPARAQAICDGLSAERIEALGRKWLA
jgi:hypothetical protein